MLHEILSVRQRPEEGFRRWFTHRDYDLILWFESDQKTLKGFQVCYNKRKREKAFTFEFGTQGHHFVAKEEPGGPSFAIIATGILRDDAGAIDPNTVLALGKELADTSGLDAEIKELIVEAMQNYQVE